MPAKAEKDQGPGQIEQKIDARFDQLSRQVTGYQRSTEELLRRLEEQLKNLEFGQQKLSHSCQNALASRMTPRGTMMTPRSLAMARLPAALNGDQKAQHEIKAIFSSERNEARAMEAVPLLSAEPPKPAAAPTGEENLTFQEKLARAQASLKTRTGEASWIKKAVNDFLEDPESSFAAACYYQFMTVFTLLAILIAAFPAANVFIPNPWSDIIDISIDALLTLEVVVRFGFYPSKLAFLTDAHAQENLVDFLSVLPLIVSVAKNQLTGGAFDASEAFLLMAVPMIRLLRLVRRFPQMQLLKAAFADCLEALPVLLYIMVVMGYGFMVLIYYFEPRENLPTMAHASWLVLSTMTTVGFGDVVPVTDSGLAVVSVLMVVSNLYMAMPLGIIGHSFTKIWGNRNQILLLQGTRSRLEKWGFGPYEIPGLFKLFDLDDSAELDLEEFHILLKEMAIGFKEDDITELFKAIDKDAGGTIDEKEFVKTLYPHEYRYMYGAKKKEGTSEYKGA